LLGASWVERVSLAEVHKGQEHIERVDDGVEGDPEIVFCVDEFGPLNLQPRPGRQWAAVSAKKKEPGRAPRPRMRAT
jgi:hypothetical protein